MKKIEGKQLVMLMAVGALAIAFMFLQYLPLYEKTKSLKAANIKLLAENAAASVRQEVLPQINAEIEKAKGEIGDFDAKIPVGRSHGEFLQNLTSVMQKQGLEEISVVPGAEIETSDLSKIPVSIRCKGKLVQVFRFFKSLEGFERIIQIENVRLTGDGKFDGSVAMEAKMNVFYRAN